METVVIGMSGGVDSSVAAHMLLEKGYRVIGLFMKNWKDCPAETDEADVALTCEILGIPHYTITLAEAYWDEVFERFLSELKDGFTPNPDVLCNEKIKFAHFFDKAMELGADFVATGHYCRTENGRLLRGKDGNKDQSYFLHRVQKEVLKKVKFPLSSLCKPRVREIAKELKLPAASKRDSTGICFIGKRDFRSFLKGYISAQKGPIVDLDGNVIGEHEGALYYTLGQRKGLGVGGPGEPWFVAGKDLERNRLIAVQGHESAALFADELQMKDVHWIGEKANQCTAKVRYRSVDVPCQIVGDRVLFEGGIWAATPGQSVVFYDGDVCLGGGFIDTVEPRDARVPLQGRQNALAQV